MYRLGFIEFRIGEANALAILVFLFNLVLIACNLLLFRERRGACIDELPCDSRPGGRDAPRSAAGDGAINLAIAALRAGPDRLGAVDLAEADRRTSSSIRRELIPAPPTLEHYRLLFDTGIHGADSEQHRSSRSASVCCRLGSAAIAAYAVARMQFRGQSALLFVIVALMSIPLPSLIVPTFTFLANVGLINSLFGLVAALCRLPAADRRSGSFTATS